VGHAGFPEVHLVVDHAGQEVSAPCINDLGQILLGSRFAFSHGADDSPAHQDKAVGNDTLVYHLRIPDQIIVHNLVLLFLPQEVALL
jgi:hypothetical protein